jgi:hypothetical protein
MVLSLRQFKIIKDYIKNNPNSRVATMYNIQNKAKYLLKQQSADRKILMELQMTHSPSYAFSGDIIHCLEHYGELYRSSI